jgi:hypothetical protein
LKEHKFDGDENFTMIQVLMCKVKPEGEGIIRRLNVDFGHEHPTKH